MKIEKVDSIPSRKMTEEEAEAINDEIFGFLKQFIENGWEKAKFDTGGNETAMRMRTEKLISDNGIPIAVKQYRGTIYLELIHEKDLK
jgi:hypothetical protein